MLSVIPVTLEDLENNNTQIRGTRQALTQINLFKMGAEFMEKQKSELNEADYVKCKIHTAKKFHRVARELFATLSAIAPYYGVGPWVIYGDVQMEALNGTMWATEMSLLLDFKEMYRQPTSYLVSNFEEVAGTLVEKFSALKELLMPSPWDLLDGWYYLHAKNQVGIDVVMPCYSNDGSAPYAIYAPNNAGRCGAVGLLYFAGGDKVHQACKLFNAEGLAFDYAPAHPEITHLLNQYINDGAILRQTESLWKELDSTI